ncbi:hypothetical protein BDK51DRAFT_33779 [Blyttiomyces helicus]|uniref:Uncharacterized protein n=1 Tax=Blyttiomyces helicus TaxID=388810 RepID=A0A4P9W589_9FUNG|nr:hypothetical protein BDK51DRAFT_33779 [Blyttiomyces helicus]|eukprot:RKO86455.1 hypothetical protein BDK51DRAFT_33779 [Blyttiomyces helicus]
MALTRAKNQKQPLQTRIANTLLRQSQVFDHAPQTFKPCRGDRSSVGKRSSVALVVEDELLLGHFEYHRQTGDRVVTEKDQSDDRIWGAVADGTCDVVVKAGFHNEAGASGRGDDVEHRRIDKIYWVDRTRERSEFAIYRREEVKTCKGPKLSIGIVQHDSGVDGGGGQDGQEDQDGQDSATTTLPTGTSTSTTATTPSTSTTSPVIAPPSTPTPAPVTIPTASATPSPSAASGLGSTDATSATPPAALIAGIVAGLALVAVAVALALLLFRRRRLQNRKYQPATEVETIVVDETQLPWTPSYAPSVVATVAPSTPLATINEVTEVQTLPSKSDPASKQIYRALCDYQPLGDDEIAISVGDEISFR